MSFATQCGCLCNVGAALKDIQDAVGERNKEDIRDKYGLGHGLKQLKMWLDKIVLIPL